MKPGIEKTLIDMIVETNESFNMMVGDSFPRKEKIVGTQHTRAWAGW